MKKTIYIITIIIGILSFSGSIWAETRVGAFNLTPQVGGYLFEGNQNLDDSFTFGLGLGYAWDQHWSTELFFNYIDAEFDNKSKDVDGYLFRLDALYHFNPERRLVPFLAAGVGCITLDPHKYRGGSDTSFLLNAGGGLKYFLTESIALRGDVRYVVPFDNTHHNLLYAINVDFVFGSKKKAVAAPPPPAPKDSDGDGVYDDQDRCPNTPSAVRVDTSGCPLDSDRDGVADYLDKCSGTPTGVKVDTDGCPLDSDRDGVYDYQDQCADTPVDLKVDKDGCPILHNEKVSITLNIDFDTDKADIKSQFHSDLKEIADFFKTYPRTTAVIEGHTDSVGPAEYNLQLSQRRAESVRKYLIEKFDINPDRLAAKGYGEARPIASNDTRQGRQQNRRVVVVNLAEKSRYEKK